MVAAKFFGSVAAHCLVALAFCGCFLLPPRHASAQMRQEVFLANTDHELHIYRVSGDEPGKTLMIIGGIQGDEPSGYISADLYADIHLKKGNLIVVPRANFYSILLSRRDGQTGDMNRKFSPDPDHKRKSHLEEEVVSILKHLIAESDCLLNLHEGSGIYNPKWINDMENPNRFGQSIIYDAEVYKPRYGHQELKLGEIASNVAQRVNQQIEAKQYHFRPNNHDTTSEESPHKEQRESATYYALTRAHIPAFGIETSKMIQSLEKKISFHKLVINAMMDEFGIIRDTPGVAIEEPKLQYLIVKVNGDYPFALQHGAVLELEPGDEVVVTDILANYSRGLVADIDAFGTTNDTNRSFRFTKPTRVFVRKDAAICGWIDLRSKTGPGEVAVAAVKKEPPPPLSQLRADALLIDVNGELKKVANAQTLIVPNSGRITLQAVRTNIAGLDNEIWVNFKGFAPPKSVNDGNDLLYPIYLAQDLLSRYSVNQKGKRYPIVASYQDRVIGHFWIEIN